MSILSNIYTINAGTSPNGTLQSWWTSYSSSTILTAFQLAKSLGFNTVRMQLPAQSGCFDFPNPTVGELANLTDACNQAAAAGVKLHFNIFYNFGYGTAVGGQYNTDGFGHIADSQAYLTAMLGAINPAVVSHIELGNEMPTLNSNISGCTSTYAGTFDSGWPGYPTLPGSAPSNENGAVALVWLQQIIPYARTQLASLFPSSTIYVTTSTVSSWGPPSAITDMIAGFTGAQIPDWYDWHVYPSSWTNIPVSIAAIKAQTDAAGALLYIGETGYQSNLSGTIAQAQWFQTVRHVCNTSGLPEPAPYTLYEASGGLSAHEGIVTAAGVLKPAAQHYLNYPLGQPVPAVGNDRIFTIGGVRGRLVGPAA